MNLSQLMISVAMVATLLPASLTSAQTFDMAKARAFYLRDIAVIKDYRAGRVSQYPFVPPRLHPGETLVLLDLKGPGFLTHTWATGKWKNEWISIYFNGEQKPSIEGKWTDIFAPSNTVTGTMARLPIALQVLPERARAFNCYIPMPFKKSVKITMQNRGDTEIADTYFIFDYVLRSSREVPDCRLVRDAKHKRFVYVGPDSAKPFDPIGSGSSRREQTGAPSTKDAQMVLKPGDEQPFLDISGSGIVETLTLRCPTPSAVRVKIIYENSTDAAVDCPLDKFFGMVNSMVLEQDGNSYRCYLPMPYRKHWRLALKNTSNAEVTVGASVVYRQASTLPADLAYLHAAWNAADGKDSVTYPLFSASGRGHFVGMLLYQPTTTVWPGDHAGADFIYGDASTSKPFSFRAIGGEDYFCAAYFGDNYATPFVGATNDYMHGGMRYRFHLEAPIPFAKSLNVDFAIYQGNSYQSIAFWYQDTPGVSGSTPSIPWRCLGPFDPDSIPAQPIATILDPGKQPDFSTTYPASLRNYCGTRFDRQARWREQVARGGFVDSTADDVIPVNGVSSTSWVLNSTWYAMTHMTLPAKQQLTLLIGHDDPIEIFIDGKLIGSFGTMKGFESSRASVSLAKGKHRIVVKCQNRPHPMSFFMNSFALVIKDARDHMLPTECFSID